MRKRFEIAVTAICVGVIVLGFTVALTIYGRYLSGLYRAQIANLFATAADRIAEIDGRSLSDSLQPILHGRRRNEAVAGVIVPSSPGQSEGAWHLMIGDQEPALFRADAFEFRDPRGRPFEADVESFSAGEGYASGSVNIDGRSLDFIGFVADSTPVAVILERDAVSRQMWTNLRPLIVIGAGVAVAVGALTYLLVRRFLRRYHDELEQANHRLEQANEKLAESNSRRAQLVHILSHDIVNPIGNVEAVLSAAEDDPDFLVSMQDALRLGARQALSITRLVRDMEKLESGERLPLVPVDLRSAVAESVETISRQAQDKEVSLIRQVEDVAVSAEPVSLVNSVLNNLLTNAVKFSTRGGRIFVRSRTRPDTGTVQLEVEDEGVGMPPEIAARLFDVTARTTRPGTEREPGTGFGMPLLARFVEAYGGSIEFDTQEDADPSGPVGHRGSRFRINLAPASSSIAPAAKTG